MNQHDNNESKTTEERYQILETVAKKHGYVSWAMLSTHYSARQKLVPLDFLHDVILESSMQASQETSLLREENEELRRTLTEARQYIATQISSIQYQHAPREYGMVECSKLANAAIAESSIIQTIDKALNPKQ
jgi:hypothetical protein